MKYHFKQKIIRQDSNLSWNYRIRVPIKIAKQLIDKDKRVICTINKQVSWHAALMPDGLNGFYIILNKANRKKLLYDQLDYLSVTLEKDTSKYGMIMPEEMSELLSQDPEGDRVFHQLTPGKQRSLIYIVAKYKSSQIRLEKALTIIEFLKEYRIEVDAKELMEAFKDRRYLD